MFKRFLFSLFTLFIYIGTVSAQVKASGTVIDQLDGLPIIGATVKVQGMPEGKLIGTVTDMDGKFAIDVPKGKKIEISYVGMESQTLVPKANMRIIMTSADAKLNEVVVTGMQKMDKRLFSGASVKLNADDIKIDGMSDVSRSLEGRAAGVSVQNVSGTFGTAPKIRVRGATSIYGSSKPLWVVDGVIMDDVTDVSADDLSSGDAETLISSAIAGLNSEDIESFQILKDGSATSIYGARAMAGVIVITTKKGRSGNSRISYTGEFSHRLIPSYRDFNIMDSQEQMGVYKEMQQKGWLNFGDTYRASESGIYGHMYKMMNSYDPVTGTYGLANTLEAEYGYLRAAEYRNTDWFQELFSSNITQQHSVGISGGTDKVSFYGSLSAMLDPGWYKQSSVSRYTANMNTTFHISPKVDFTMVSMGSYRKQKAPGTLSQSIDPVSGEVNREFDINPYSYAINSSRTLDPTVYYTRNFAPFNIHNELDNNYMNIDVVNLKFQAELKYKPIRGLELAVLGAAQYTSTGNEHIISDGSNQAMAYRSMDDSTIRDKNPYLYNDPDNDFDLPVSILPQGGIYQKTANKMLSYDFRATASYNFNYNEVHLANLFAGLETNGIDRNRTYFNGWGMQYTTGEIPFYVYEYFKKCQEEGTDYYSLTNTKSRSAAFFANLNYSYDSRYSFNATFRYDGTNRLGRSRSARWLPTWNVSGRWNASSEKFWEKVGNWFSTFDVKLSYSLTGDPGPGYVSNSLIEINSYKPYRPTTSVQETGLHIVNLANDGLTYEKKHEFNLGFDFGFLDNRINLEFDWYTRNNFDLIGQIQTPGTGGQITKYANVASMKSSGVEFTLSTRNIKTKDFSWDTNLIFSKAKNEVTKLEANTMAYQLVQGTGFALEGYPVRSLFSFDFRGLNSDGLPTFAGEDGRITADGSNLNFQSYENSHLVYEGPTDPTVTGSLGNVFRWKNLKLNIFITYSFGNVVRLDPSFSSRYSDLDATPREFKNRWVMSGDEAYTNIPTIATARQNYDDVYLKTLYNAYNYSTERIAKGDFIRMKEISITYDFPKKLLQPLHLSDASVKLQATNLFLIYSDKKLNGQDPEFFRSGGVAAPVPKQFTLTLRFGI